MTDVPTGAITHIAGLDVQVGPYLRQRCAWCGAMLDNYNLAQVAVPEGQNPRPKSCWVRRRLLRQGSSRFITATCA